MSAPNEHRKLAVRIYLSDATLRETELRTGYCIGTIRSWVRAAGHKCRSERPQKYKSRTAPDRRRKINTDVMRKMLDEGMTQSAIAQHFGVTRQAINWNVKHGKWR